MLPVGNLKLCMLLLGWENYSLSLLTIKSHTSVNYLLTNLLIEQIQSYKSNLFSASQKISHF